MAKIEIFGLDNHVLIDETFQNMILIQKRTINFPAIGGTYLGTTTSFSYGSNIDDTPIVAIHSAFQTSLMNCVQSGNSWTWDVACEAAGVGGTAEVFIFHVPRTITNPSGILQLYSPPPEHKLVFDSNQRYMKIEKPFFMTMDNATSASLPTGKKYAAFHCKVPSFYSILPGSLSCGPTARATYEQRQLNGTAFSDGLVRSSAYILMQREYCATPPYPSGGSFRTKDGLAMIVDITGY